MKTVSLFLNRLIDAIDERGGLPKLSRKRCWLQALALEYLS